MKNKLLLVLPVLLAVVLFYGYSTQDNPKDKFVDVNKDGVAPVYHMNNSAALLWDNTNIAATTNGIVSVQLRGKAQDSNLAQTADDFIVPVGVNWTIDSIYVRGFYSAGSTPMDSLGIMVFADSSGTAAARPLQRRGIIPNRRTNGDTLSKTLSSPIALSAGHYWISFYGVFNTSTTLTTTRWNWTTGATAIQTEDRLRDETGLFGLPDHGWKTLSSLGVTGAPSCLFGLYGTSAVPGGGTITMCRSVSKVIPDNQGDANPMIDTISISGIPANMQIKKIVVSIDSVTHTWVGDLRYWLQKGSVVDTIVNRVGVGVGGSTVGYSCDNFIGTRLVDSVPSYTNIQNVVSSPLPTCAAGAPATLLTGNFAPKNPLGVFQSQGIDPNGLYILKVSDNAAQDTGRVRKWCITVTYDLMTGVPGNTNIVDGFKLSQNYPNPFNPTTKINFSLPKQGLVTLKVYDMLGKEVAELVNEFRSIGNYSVDFNASNLSSGVYFYKLTAGEFVETKRMLLVK